MINEKFSFKVFTAHRQLRPANRQICVIRLGKFEKGSRMGKNVPECAI
jgi:hypothetical protein